jgi:hypothetical protein
MPGIGYVKESDFFDIAGCFTGSIFGIACPRSGKLYVFFPAQHSPLVFFSIVLRQ